MWEVGKALIFMAVGGVLTHLSWRHAWRMYREGKKESAPQTRGARYDG